MRWRAIGLVMLGACASAQPVVQPQPTVDAYLKAVERSDADAMYALLSEERRAQLSVETFRARHADMRTELAESVQRIRDTGSAAEATAIVTLDNGDTVQLVLEGGEWRIAAGLLDAASLRTPVDAVMTLRRVLLRRDLAGMLALLSREERAGWEAALGRLIDGTADALDWETEIAGDQATVRITGGGVILLRRESGRWRVHDIREPAP